MGIVLGHKFFLGLVLGIVQGEELDTVQERRSYLGLESSMGMLRFDQGPMWGMVFVRERVSALVPV